VPKAESLLHLSDEELLAKFLGGERESFAVLVRRYERELYGYLRRYTGDASLAEDVFQNTFLQLYTKMETFDMDRKVRPWLYTIATHQAIDAMRRAGRHQAVSLDQYREESTNGEVQSLIALLESQESNPLAHAEKEERKELVRESVERLPDFLQQVVILAYYQNLKYREVAEILGIPVGTVKSRLHSALLRLQEMWIAVETTRET